MWSAWLEEYLLVRAAATAARSDKGLTFLDFYEIWAKGYGGKVVGCGSPEIVNGVWLSQQNCLGF